MTPKAGDSFPLPSLSPFRDTCQSAVIPPCRGCLTLRDHFEDSLDMILRMTTDLIIAGLPPFPMYFSKTSTTIIAIPTGHCGLTFV
jgi:hypothetical protein